MLLSCSSCSVGAHARGKRADGLAHTNHGRRRPEMDRPSRSRPRKQWDESDDRPQHASASSPSEGGGGRLRLTLGKKPAAGGGKALKLTLKRPSAGASGGSASKRLKLKVPNRRDAHDVDGGAEDSSGAELSDPSASSARLPSRAAAAARREHLEGARTTKLTFKRDAERSEGNLPAATRLTLKVPAGSSKSSSKKRSRASKRGGGAAAAIEPSASPAQPAALRLAIKPLTPTQRMRAVWRAVMDATDASDRRRAEIFERLPSPEEMPMYYEVIADPIDLDRIEAKLAMGEKQPGGYGAVNQWAAFTKDMLLVFNNARLFNGEESQIFNDANCLEIIFHNAVDEQQVAAAAAAAGPGLAAAMAAGESCDLCCDTCNTWYTTQQVGLSVKEAEALEHWHCEGCVRKLAADFGGGSGANSSAATDAGAGASIAAAAARFCDLCCDTCETWYTTLDAGITVEEAEALDEWHCGVCLGTHKAAAKKPKIDLAGSAGSRPGHTAGDLVEGNYYSSAAAAAYAAEVEQSKRDANWEYYTGPALPDLPDDLLVQILKGAKLKEMQAVTLVSVSWHTIASRDNVWRTICEEKLRDFHPPRRIRRSWMRIFFEQMIEREKKIEESSQRMFLKCDVIFRARTDNFSKLRKILVDHKVGEGPDDEISIDRRGGTTWEDNPLVNLATREGRQRCVKELVEQWGASIEIKDVGGFTPILEAAYHGHEPLLKYLLNHGANIDVQGVSLGTQSGNERSQNGPFSPLEWARRQGHRRCAEILEHAGSKDAREDAKTRAIVRTCLGGIVDIVCREERQQEREGAKEQREIADVVRKMVLEVERRGREELKRKNEIRRKVREEEQKQRAIAKCLEDIIKQIAREEDRVERERRAVWFRAERERADVKRAAKEVAACVERLIWNTEREEVMMTRGAAQCVERMIRTLERREASAVARECRDCLNAVIRRVVMACDPDGGMNVQTYLSLRGLGAWTSHFMGFMKVATPTQARAITKEDLERLGTDFLNTPIDESTITTVLERLVMEIDADVAGTYCSAGEAKRRKQEAAAAAAAEREAAAERLVAELLQLVSNDGGHVPVRGIDGARLDQADLELCGLQDLATDAWHNPPADHPAASPHTATAEGAEAVSPAKPVAYVPLIVKKLRTFCDKSSEGRLRVVAGTGCKQKHLPYATETLQVEPPETKGRIDGVFFTGDVCKLLGGTVDCPQPASGMGTVRVLRLLPADDGRVVVQSMKEDGLVLPVPPTVLRLKPDRADLKSQREAKAAAKAAKEALLLEQQKAAVGGPKVGETHVVMGTRL